MLYMGDQTGIFQSFCFMFPGMRLSELFMKKSEND